MEGRALASLGAGLVLAVLVGALLVPVRAWSGAIVPVLITVVLGGLVMTAVARRRPTDGSAPDHDPFGLVGDRLDRFEQLRRLDDELADDQRRPGEDGLRRPGDDELRRPGQDGLRRPGDDGLRRPGDDEGEQS